MAILINCKDSVRGHIEVLYEHLHNIVKRIQGKGKIKSTNLALVLYRDKSCEINRFTLPFVREPEKLKDFIDEKCLFP